MARAIAALRVSAAAALRSLENQCLILFLARALLTNCSQSRLGAASWALEVKISTVSPLFSWLSSATRRPLTRAPIVRWPTSVWIAYAKSPREGAEAEPRRCEDPPRIGGLALPVDELPQPGQVRCAAAARRGRLFLVLP